MVRQRCCKRRPGWRPANPAQIRAPRGGLMQEFDPHVLEEKPIPPPAEFSKRAHVKSLEEYGKMYESAQNDPEGFWGQQAKMLDWFTPPTRVLEWDLPHAKWFVGGKLNVSSNCPRPAPGGQTEQARPLLGSRRRQDAGVHLYRIARACVPVCERAVKPRSQNG
jgi:hypothetical protein